MSESCRKQHDGPPAGRTDWRGPVHVLWRLEPLFRNEWHAEAAFDRPGEDVAVAAFPLGVETGCDLIAIYVHQISPLGAAELRSGHLVISWSRAEVHAGQPPGNTQPHDDCGGDRP